MDRRAVYIALVADVENFVEYLDTEFNDGGLPFYPVGSMQAITFGMADASMQRGVRIYTSEPVLSVDRSGANYRLITAAHSVTAARVMTVTPRRAS